MSARLSDNIAAYDEMRRELEMDRNGEWIVIYGRLVSGCFESMEEAAQHAAATHGRGPYLIRRVGAPPLQLPASAIYQQWEPVRARG